jgi:deoxycytidylate deaminase
VYYQKARELAMNNGRDFHLAAVLFRNNHVVRIGTNSSKTHPRFRRTHKNGQESSHLHAEMDVLRFAKPGDTLLVIRFSARGQVTMAKPCEHCQKHIRDAGITKVRYTDWNGEAQEWKVGLD